MVLTRDSVANSIGSVVVALVTRTVRGLPTEVRLGKREGLAAPCVINLDNILTVPRGRLTRLLGSCSASKVRELDIAIKLALGVDP